MHKHFLALSLSLLAFATPGCAAPRSSGVATPGQAAVMATVHQFVSGFNVSDTALAIAACTDEMSIIDEFPPYEWHGPGALKTWLADYDTNAKKEGITAGIVTLAAPRCVDISGDRAYVVAPADYYFSQQGKPVQEIGATFTFALHKVAAGWRITGWSWSKS